jgi:hypothetical protein
MVPLQALNAQPRAAIFELKSLKVQVMHLQKFNTTQMVKKLVCLARHYHYFLPTIWHTNVKVNPKLLVSS